MRNLFWMMLTLLFLLLAMMAVLLAYMLHARSARREISLFRSALCSMEAEVKKTSSGSATASVFG